MNCQTIAANAMDDMFIEYAIMACSFARFKAIDTGLHYMNVDRGGNSICITSSRGI